MSRKLQVNFESDSNAKGSRCMMHPVSCVHGGICRNAFLTGRRIQRSSICALTRRCPSCHITHYHRRLGQARTTKQVDAAGVSYFARTNLTQTGNGQVDPENHLSLRGRSCGLDVGPSLRVFEQDRRLNTLCICAATDLKLVQLTASAELQRHLD